MLSLRKPGSRHQRGSALLSGVDSADVGAGLGARMESLRRMASWSPGCTVERVRVYKEGERELDKEREPRGSQGGVIGRAADSRPHSGPAAGAAQTALSRSLALPPPALTDCTPPASATLCAQLPTPHHFRTSTRCTRRPPRTRPTIGTSSSRLPLFPQRRTAAREVRLSCLLVPWLEQRPETSARAVPG